MIYVVKKANESSDRLANRLKKIAQRARLNEIKWNRYFSPKKTKKRLREEAISRAKYRTKRERAKYYS